MARTLVSQVGSMHKLEVVPCGEKVRTFGGWYKHDVVKIDGVVVGRIQERRRNKRNNFLTLDTTGACVLGIDCEWLGRRAMDLGLIEA